MTARAAASLLAVLVAAATLSACGAGQSPGAALRSWASANQLGTAAADLLGDSRRDDTAIARHEGAAVVRTTCEEALQDALGINGDLLPTPDPQLTTLLSGAVERFAGLASRCATHASDQRVLAAVVRGRFAALGALDEAVLREEAVTSSTLVVSGPS